MKKRTAYPFGEASYAQRLPLGEGRKEQKGIRVSESYCVSPIYDKIVIHTYSYD
jgi:hypothetical protein